VPAENLLASVEGVMNGIVVRGNAIGDVMFYGAGAGKLPTASAVVADIIDAAKHDHARRLISWDEGTENMMRDPSELEDAWYARAAASEDAVRRALPDAKIIGGDGVETAVITHKMKKSAADAALAGLSIASLFRVLGTE
jgi:homoserine dehydrogenase